MKKPSTKAWRVAAIHDVPVVVDPTPIAQKRCEVCGGSGLVLTKEDYVKCPGCAQPHLQPLQSPTAPPNPKLRSPPQPSAPSSTTSQKISTTASLSAALGWSSSTALPSPSPDRHPSLPFRLLIYTQALGRWWSYP
ncbi:hypothetical protein ACE6H2_015118 [Prunus campanulata]